MTCECLQHLYRLVPGGRTRSLVTLLRGPGAGHAGTNYVLLSTELFGKVTFTNKYNAVRGVSWTTAHTSLVVP